MPGLDGAVVCHAGQTVLGDLMLPPLGLTGPDGAVRDLMLSPSSVWAQQGQGTSCQLHSALGAPVGRAGKAVPAHSPPLGCCRPVPSVDTPGPCARERAGALDQMTTRAGFRAHGFILVMVPEARTLTWVSLGRSEALGAPGENPASALAGLPAFLNSSVFHTSTAASFVSLTQPLLCPHISDSE